MSVSSLETGDGFSEISAGPIEATAHGVHGGIHGFRNLLGLHAAQAPRAERPPGDLGAHHGPWSLGTRVSQTVLVDRLPPGCALGPGCPVAPDRFRYFIEELP